MTDLIHLDTPADIARAVNLVMAVTIIAVAAWQWRTVIDVPRARLFLRLSIGAFVAATALGSWETLTDPDPAPGVRSWMYTVALAWTLYAMWLEHHDRNQKE